MPHGGHRQWGSRFCLGIPCLGSRGAQEVAELSGNEPSATEHSGAATGPSPTPALNLPLRVRADTPRETGLEHQHVDENPAIAEPQDREMRLPPSLLDPSGPPFTSFASLGFQISRAHSSVDNHHEHEPVNAETSIASEEPRPHPSDAKISQKKRAAAFAKAALRVAAAGLKAAPIPNLDQIPNILLALIQTYEVSNLAGFPLKQY